MVNYSLSGAATKDIVNIYKYGGYVFGLTQARTYMHDLEIFIN